MYTDVFVYVYIYICTHKYEIFRWDSFQDTERSRWLFPSTRILGRNGKWLLRGGGSLGRYWPTVKQEETDRWIQTMSLQSKLHSVNSKSSNKVQDKIGVLVNFVQYWMKNKYQAEFKFSRKWKRNNHFQTHFKWWHHPDNTDRQRRVEIKTKTPHRPIFLVNTDRKVLSKTLVS